MGGKLNLGRKRWWQHQNTKVLMPWRLSVKPMIWDTRNRTVTNFELKFQLAPQFLAGTQIFPLPETKQGSPPALAFGRNFG